MPQVIATTVYQYDELPTEQAKQKAREWYNEGNNDTGWADYVIDHWQDEKLPALGYNNAQIKYSGFWSKGDGASFTADVDFLKYCQANEVKLPRLLKQRLEKGTVQVWGKIVRTSHHYCHENTVGYDYCDVQVNEGRTDLMRQQVQTIWLDMIGNARAKMREIYRELETAYDYEASEENVAENIRANEYTFTEDGERFG
jgi:hypothetical protein